MVSACLHRIDTHDRQLHAFVDVYREEALASARAMDGRRAAGTALLFDVLSGRQIGGSVRGLRAWVLPDIECVAIEPAGRAIYLAALETLSMLGVHLVRAQLPQRLVDYMKMAGRLMSAEGYARLGPLFEREDLRFDPHVRRRVLVGRDISAADYQHLQRERQLAQQAMVQAMEGVDLCVFPTNPIVAIPVDQVDEDATTLSLLGSFVNLLNLCSVAVPTGQSQGLPVSMQIIGQPHAEGLVLRVAHAFQQTYDWYRLVPQGLAA